MIDLISSHWRKRGGKKLNRQHLVMNNVLSFKDGDKSGDLLYFTGYFILRVQMT